MGVGGGGRLVEVLVGGEAAGVAGEGEATEGVTGYCVQDSHLKYIK